MESAGRGAAAVLAGRFPERVRSGVVVATGPGNNGGDGWVLARALHAAGAPVWVAPAEAPRGELPQAVAGAAREAGVRELGIDGPWPNPGILVDALLGTGARGAPRSAVAVAIQRIAELDLPVVAIDGPSGLDLGDGVQHGPLRAALSITFGGYRRGHLLARDDVGDVVAIDIGLPPHPTDWPGLLTESDVAASVVPFAAAVHKGQRGRIVIVGGDEGMTGAARLAARAAFAAGAGLVHVVAPPGSVAVLAAGEPDLQTTGQPFEARPNPRTEKLVASADALIIGPGLGRSATRPEFVAAILQAAPPDTPVLLDADALVVFAGQVDRLAALLQGRPAILTPHAGEFRSLFPELASRTTVDPWGAAAAAAEQLGATVLLKGVPTVVASTGRTLTIAAGNPGLASGGSGDTLSGLTATLAAQGTLPSLAGAAASFLAGEAADLAARRVSARSMRPMDVLAALPDVWRRLELVRRSPSPPRPPILHELAAPLAV